MLLGRGQTWCADSPTAESRDIPQTCALTPLFEKGRGPESLRASPLQSVYMVVVVRLERRLGGISLCYPITASG